METHQSQLASISGIVNQFTDNAEPILLGDFQQCPDYSSTCRSSKPNALSRHLSDFIGDNDLTPIDIVYGNGPAYTYQHFSLPSPTYIDYPSLLTYAISNTSVLEPDPDNISDQILVSNTINLPQYDEK